MSEYHLFLLYRLYAYASCLKISAHAPVAGTIVYVHADVRDMRCVLGRAVKGADDGGTFVNLLMIANDTDDFRPIHSRYSRRYTGRRTDGRR